jgi:hypothetical protein
MQGQVAVPPRPSIALSAGAVRLIGFATAAIGLALIAGVTSVFSVTPCNNQGGPTGCFFTPPQDTGTPMASLKTAQPIPHDSQLNVGGPFIADKTAVLQLGKAFFWDT